MSVKSNKIPTHSVFKESEQVADKINLLGMTQSELEGYFKTLGEKAFRAKQVMQWIYQFGVTDLPR